MLSNDIKDNLLVSITNNYNNTLKIQLVGNTIKERLRKKFQTIHKLMDAKDSEVMKIQAIGTKRLEYINIAIRDYISG